MKKHIQLIIGLVLFSFIAMEEATAQQLKTTYFMETATLRNSANPALLPSRGYFNLPAIGGLSMDFKSNALTVDKIFFKRNGELVTFLDPSVSANEFLSGLKNDNNINIDYGMNILGFGFYSGRNFWSFDVKVNAYGGVSLPKSFFEFAKVGGNENGTFYDLKNLKVEASAYASASLGWSRLIGENLTIGARVKYIAGILDGVVDIEEMKISLREELWQIKAKGNVDISMNGIEPKMERDNNGNEYFNSVDLDNFKGIGGHGFGVDLGASYRLFNHLVLSAAVIDLGFIQWKAKNSIKGVSAKDFTFSGFDVGDDNGGSSDDEFFDDLGDLVKFERVKSADRKTKLRTTVNVGAEWQMFRNRLSFGMLSQTQFRASENITELTASVNYRPIRWFGASVSYSLLNSDFKTLGAAINIAPSWINLFVGTDYILGKVTPQFVPLSQKVANVYVGIGIPMTKRNYSK